MRLIDADALLEHKFVSINCYLKSNVDNGYSQYKQGWNDAIDAIIDNAPTACNDNYAMGYQDGVKKVLSERPTAKWIGKDGYFQCDKCYGKLWYRSDYCPQCGRRMEAENDL